MTPGPFTIRDRVIWITGASSGIGAAVAEFLARRGARLVLSARRGEVLEEVRSGLIEPERHLVVPLDLAAHETHPAIVADVLARTGGVDTMIHNGGISQRSLVAETDLEVDRRLVEVNYLGTVSLTKALIPSMLEAGAGRFVVVTSVVGKFGTPLRSGYAASKHALHGFFDSLRAELHDQGIRVHMVCPGFVNTQVSVNALAGDGSAHGVLDEGQRTGMAPAVCAEKMVRGLEDDRDEFVVAGPRETLAVWLSRHLPSALRRIVRRAAVD